MTEIPFKGNVKSTSLPRVLTYLNRNRKSGTLILKTPVFIKKVYLVKGDAIFASSTYEDDRLGEMLIKAGKITMEQYDESVDLLKKTGKRQGAILVDLGYLTPKDLFWGVKYQVREIIFSLFLLEDAEYQFAEDEIPEQEVITLKMSMGNLIYEGVKRIDNWTRIRSEMPGAETVLKLSADPVSLFQDIEISAQDRKMLSLIDGAKTIRELIDSAWVGSFEGLKILYVLWSIGVIEERMQATEEVEETIFLDEMLQPASEDENIFLMKVDEMYSKIDQLSPDEMLNVDDSSDEDTVKRNYYNLTREFHPDRSLNTADPSLKDKLTAISDALTRAYTEIRDRTRAEAGRAEAPGGVDGTKHFTLGVEAFKKGKFRKAVDSFRSAVRSEPNNAKYWSYLSLSLSKVPDMVDDAVKALLNAIQIEPRNADHRVNLGLMYVKQGMKKMAHEQFREALDIDPSNARAAKGLEKTKS
jgi:tetratricopeptide (TPR) repeat protein